MKKLLLLCLTLTALTPASSQTQAEMLTRLTGIDTQIEQVMKDWKITGLAVGVVYKDQLLYAKGYGYRDLRQQLPVTPNTVFPIASCTKAFTGMVVGIAADKKLLDINRPVHRYLPELEFYTPEMTAMITAKDLLTHRTGLPRHDWMNGAKVPLSADTIIRRIRHLEPSKGIREEVQYNNLMYYTLGEVTRRLTGKSWAEQIREQIFEPLEMKASTTGFSDLPNSPEYSKGYVIVRDSVIAGAISNEGANPAGSINSSVTDMSKWLIAWINNGRYKGKQVFPERFAKEASSPQMSTPSRPNPRFPAYPDAFFGDFGYGWIIDSYRGHYHVQHSGDLPLFSSNTAFFPTDSIGIVVLVNKFNATMPELISSHIADKLLQLPHKDWNKLLRALQSKPSAASVQPASLKPEVQPVMAHRPEEYAGTYYHPGYGFIQIILTDGKLTATHNDRPFSFTLKTGDVFQANVPGGELRFAAAQDGKIVSVGGSFEEGIKDIIFFKK